MAIFVAGALMFGAGPAAAQVCDGPADSLAASRDLYCMTLVATGDVDTASGHVELGRIPGPFTVDVTADGRPIYRPVVTVAGLPAPRALGAYTVYVAWAASPTMGVIRRLGIVANGRTVATPFAIDPFLILISAEASRGGTEPKGRIVLRGGSPSTRLQPPDLMQFSIGATSPSDRSVDPMAGSGGPDSNHQGARWTSVPMVAGVRMLPAEMALRPLVAPYLPQVPAGAARPVDGQPGTALQLRDGDTLHLAAGMVQRTIRGQAVTMYAFNGQYPGPLLTVRQGAQIVVDFANHLDRPTAVHWHGIRLDNAFDGVPGLTQSPVLPGGHFTYRVHFPDAGLYWYHPHVREDMQQALGLFGDILVRSPRRDYFGPADREAVLILNDLLMTGDGLVPFGRDTATHALMGRFGNVLLVNGSPRYALSVRRGEVVRFFLTNASNTRTYNLSFPGARMKVIASGGGNFEREAWIPSVVIAPAERYVVEVRFTRPGRTPLINSVQGLDHLFNRFVPMVDTLGVVTVRSDSITSSAGSRFATLRADRVATADIDRFRPYFTRPVDHTLLLTLTTRKLPFVTRQLMQLDSVYFTPIEWSGTMPNMNWASTTDQIQWALRDPATGRENMDIGWTFHRGDIVKIRLVNDRRALHGMQHPIHVHGQRFLVVAVNGVPNEDLAWKDTVLVPAGGAVDILLDLSNPGRWMVHCHIAEHLAAQMMSVFTVQ